MKFNVFIFNVAANILYKNSLAKSITHDQVLCTSCHFIGRFKLAEEDLQQALELKPDFGDALLNLNQVRHDLQTGYQFNKTEN